MLVDVLEPFVAHELENSELMGILGAPRSAGGVVSCDGGGELALRVKATQAQTSFSAARADFQKVQ